MNKLFGIVITLFCSLSWANQLALELINISTWKDAQQSPLNPDNYLKLDLIENETAVISSGYFAFNGINVNFRNRLSYTNSTGYSVKDKQILWQELSIDHVINNQWIANIGKTQLPWDMATSFQPLGFFQQDLNVKDITDNQSRSSGLPLIALTHLAENWNASFVYSHDIENDKNGLNQGLEQWASKFSYFKNQWEIGFVAQKPQGQSIGFGGNFHYTLNDHTVLYGSGFMRQGTKLPQNSLLANNDKIADFVSPITSHRINDKNTYTRYVVGTNITFERFGVVAEYAHDDRALSNRQWQRLTHLVAEHNQMLTDLNDNNDTLAKVNLSYDYQSISATGALQDYLFLNLSFDSSYGTWNLYSRVELQNHSSYSGLSYQATLHNQVDLFVTYFQFNGSKRTEFGILPIKSEFEIMLKFFF